MTDIVLVATIVAFFVAAALLVRVIDGMVTRAAEESGTEADIEPGSRR